MNGAESLVETLAGAGVEVCFANPGTSEMHFVAALDRVGGVRCVLGLFEGVATGAADGYARMADKPASTLLHLGPGLANAYSAQRVNTPEWPISCQLVVARSKRKSRVPSCRRKPRGAAERHLGRGPSGLRPLLVAQGKFRG